MIQSFSNRTRRLKADQRGSIAPIFAIMLLALLVILGFALDFRRIASVDARVQTATDAASLAGALVYAQNAQLPDGQRLALATDAVNATLAAELQGPVFGLEITSIAVATVGEQNDGIQATVRSNLPLAFGGLFGRSDVDITTRSSASGGGPQNVEIVLALDNTGSMFRNNRFNLMRSATKNFVNDLYDDATGPGQTYVGIVPWATTVNINSERPGGFDTSRAASRSPGADGTRTVPNAPFQDRVRYLLEPEEEVNYDPADLERDFAPVEWRGCIRSAPGERRVSNAGTVQSPLTDDVVRGFRWHASLIEPQLRDFAAPASFTGATNPVNAGFTINAGRIVQCSQPDASNFNNVHMDVDRACINTANSNRIDLVEACVSDPSEFEYFRRGGAACPWQRDIFPWTFQRPISGPNQNCPVAMLGLSQDRAQLVDKLDEMYPVTGGTHMDVGLTWGLRMLSPRSEWANFFGQDRPTAYDDASTRKVLVLLTDGQNIAPLIEGYYGCARNQQRGAAGPCWQAPDIGNLSPRSLNNLTADACTQIRDEYGIEVFTIAVDITNATALDILADCAGESDRAFNIRAAELDTVFQSIAARQLRLLE